MSIHYSDKLNPRRELDDVHVSCRDGRNPVITLNYLSSLRRCNPLRRRGSYLIDILRLIDEYVQVKREIDERELAN